MNKDVTQFIDRLHGISAELKQRVVEAETLALSKDEVVEFSRLFVLSATVLTAAEKAFVRQEKISYVCVGLTAFSFSILVPAFCLLSPLLFPSVPNTGQLSNIPDFPNQSKQLHRTKE
jgi:hypothetical protein